MGDLFDWLPVCEGPDAKTYDPTRPAGKRAMAAARRAGVLEHRPGSAGLRLGSVRADEKPRPAGAWSSWGQCQDAAGMNSAVANGCDRGLIHTCSATTCANP